MTDIDYDDDGAPIVSQLVSTCEQLRAKVEALTAERDAARAEAQRERDENAKAREVLDGYRFHDGWIHERIEKMEQSRRVYYRLYYDTLELAQAFRGGIHRAAERAVTYRLRALALHHLLRRYRRSERVCYANYKREIDAVRAEVERLRADVTSAATDLKVPVPEPGSDMARVLIANRLLKVEVERLRADAEIGRAYRECLTACYAYDQYNAGDDEEYDRLFVAYISAEDRWSDVSRKTRDAVRKALGDTKGGANG